MASGITFHNRPLTEEAIENIRNQEAEENLGLMEKIDALGVAAIPEVQEELRNKLEGREDSYMSEETENSYLAIMQLKISDLDNQTDPDEAKESVQEILSYIEEPSELNEEVKARIASESGEDSSGSEE